MTVQALTPWPILNRQLLERFAAAALIVLLLSQTLLEIFPATLLPPAAPALPLEAEAIT